MASLNSSKASAGWQLVTGIVLGAGGTATDVFTWTHGRGVKAAMIHLVDSTNKAPVLATDVAVTQPSTSIITLDEAGAGRTVDMLVLWLVPEKDNIRPITAAELITAGEAALT